MGEKGLHIEMGISLIITLIDLEELMRYYGGMI